MANVIIKLIVNKATGKKDVVISYESDSDALPIEHEDEHRRIVNALIEGGALKAAEVGSIVVTREQAEPEGAARKQEEPQASPQALTNKGG